MTRLLMAQLKNDIVCIYRYNKQVTYSITFKCEGCGKRFDVNKEWFRKQQECNDLMSGCISSYEYVKGGRRHSLIKQVCSEVCWNKAPTRSLQSFIQYNGASAGVKTIRGTRGLNILPIKGVRHNGTYTYKGLYYRKRVFTYY